MQDKALVGIIGGTGLMGQLFKSFFERYGHEVLVAGRKTELSMEECAKKVDVLVISVAMEVTVSVIEKLAPLVKKDGLIMDLTSLKIDPLNAMLKHANCDVLATHPVFGPGIKSFKNQTMVICPGRGQKWQDWLISLLEKEEAKIKVTSAEDHDKMMGVIQALIHFSTITIGHVLKELGVDIEESRLFSSPIYKIRLDMVGRILNQNPSLYANIEILNPLSSDIIKTYMGSCNKLFSMIENKDFNGFISYFKEASDYMGDFTKEAENYSDYLIEKLVDKK